MADNTVENDPGQTSAFKVDLSRYPKRPWLKEQSIWAVALYRMGQWNDRRKSGLTRWLLDRIYWVAYRIIETITGITMPKMVEIGPGLRIYKFGGISVHHHAKVGARRTLRQGVTIGNLGGNTGAPIVDDDVEFGAYSQALGPIHIGKGAKIGPMSLVLIDVPAYASVLGNPARIMFIGEPKEAQAT